jgi:Trypsin-like peptidase domain/Gram-negative bacterial TonB protein C-terminal
MNSHRNAPFASVAVMLVLSFAPSARAASDAFSVIPLAAAVCPIVYPVDQSPSDRGYHYIFYGNAFFINKDGYLITAAHVLSQLRDSQPYLLLQLPMAPPRLVKATVVTIDLDHDVAVLRATPNPFTGRYRVNFLRLATDRAQQNSSVLADALRPSRLKNPYTFDALIEDRPAGQLLEYRFTPLDKGRPETEIFLFNHDVLLGDSGAPVVSTDSQQVVGLVEGRWLHGSSFIQTDATQKQSAVVGAVVPIHYAIALLAQNRIAWETDAAAPVSPQPSTGEQSSQPVPLSLVAASYPAGVFSGADVVLDAAVDSTGKLADLRVLQGENPFLEKVLASVNSWTFQPASAAEKLPPTRISIVFQFSGSFTSASVRQAHAYVEQLAGASERAAQPLVDPEPDFPSAKLAEGSVILCEQVDSHGQLDSVQVLRGPQSLTTPAIAAARQWRFAPARRAGAGTDSEVIVVVIFRPSAVSPQAHASKSSR